MIDETTSHDIQAEVDGENLPEESARVRELIARDPEAAALYEELKELARTLASVPAERPPEALKHTVEGMVAWRARGAEKNDKGRQLREATQGTTTGISNREGTVKGKYVIAGLLAAGIAGVVFYFGGIDFPPKNDEAVGTIGAVKKHHVEQISEGDVVLGTTPADAEWVPFADVVGDAGALGSASARLESISKDFAKGTLDAKAAAVALKGVDAALESRALQMQARTQQALELQAKQLALAVEARTTLAAKAATLDAKRVDAIRLEAKDLAAQLEARTLDFAGASSKLGALSRELAASSKLEARTIEASSRLEAFAKSLEAKGNLEAKSLEADLGSISTALKARAADFAAETLGARSAYLDAAVKLQADLVGAREKLGKFSSLLEASSKLEAKDFAELNKLSESLQARASEFQQSGLAGMREQLQASSRSFDALMGMKANAELASRRLEARNLSLEGRTTSEEFTRTLGMMTMDAASRLGSACRNDLGSIERSLGARDLAFGAKVMTSLNEHLGSVTRSLESSSLAATLESKQFAALQEQLGSASRSLQARTPDAQ